MKRILQKLDDWVIGHNLAARSGDGSAPIGKIEVRVLGQEALLVAQVDLDIAASMDVDAYLVNDPRVRTHFDQLLRQEGKHLDPDSDKVWMPAETEYVEFFKGRRVTGFHAAPDYVLLSKALKAPEKNTPLLIEYLAKGATPTFLKLARKYRVSLEAFL